MGKEHMPEADCHTTETKMRLLLASERPDLSAAADLALGSEEALREAVSGLTSKNEDQRYNSFRVLLRIAEERPEVLYPFWDRLAELLPSSNAYHRSAAVQLLAPLVRAGTENRFDRLADSFFGLLHDESIITARYVARVAGAIGTARPSQRATIVEKLLQVDQSLHKQKELLKADVIASLGQLFAEHEDKARLVSFVRQQLNSPSPKTREAARAFLEQHRV